ncbi:MAG: YjzC family protein [Alloalcanivorax venustensis]|uniref:YjzC family protein n=1 Tax=Alloalcanivorax venustensis TaxID=172371 RepID=UPI000EE93AF9|nr:YjzC family protein [Methylophaga sp.]
MPNRQKPGEAPRRPGEYRERGRRGGDVPKPREVTIEPGDERMPPTQKPGRIWERIGPPKN